MCKTLKTLPFVLVLSACLITSAAAKEEVITINDLVNDTLGYNGQTVTVEGEAIGEALERGEYSWVNISDGTNAIGIWMTKADEDTIKYYGDFKNLGDTVKVTGVFSRDCSEHGGDVDIHCSSLTIVKSGHSVISAVSQKKLIVAAVLAFFAALLAFFYRRESKKRKSSD
ncbi:MAG: DNA-binding protein [Clostridia bacterium]|nr:DNA-binding protein [Clostridia bacterium]